MTRRTAYIAIALMWATLLPAQDVQRFSQRDISGSARYVGMGGAMTAIGGDPTAAMDNPAGLGLYRRKEISVSFDRTWDYTRMPNQRTQDSRSQFSLPHVSVVWSFGIPYRQSGVVFNNTMLSAHRMANFDRTISASRVGNAGLAATVCEKTNGLTEQDLAATDDYMSNLWNNPDIGWLSILGYNAYLINPLSDGSDQWVPAVRMNNAALNISESGNADQYSVSWAMNISNQWYVGLGLNIPTLVYSKEMSLTETGAHGNEVLLKSRLSASGVGFGATVGAIYRPCQWVRIGASFQTPSVMNIGIKTEGIMSSTIDTLGGKVITPETNTSVSRWVMPLRVSAGVALQVMQYAMLSLQYDYAHWQTMTDVHTFRAGAEVNIAKGLYINGGYVCEPMFGKQDPISPLDYTSIRTDTDFRVTRMSQYASVGIGYRWSWFLLNAAYQYRWQDIHQYATEMQTEPFDITARTHRFTFTLAWRFN